MVEEETGYSGEMPFDVSSEPEEKIEEREIPDRNPGEPEIDLLDSIGKNTNDVMEQVIEHHRTDSILSRIRAEDEDGER
jgi:hypothetical protein